MPHFWLKQSTKMPLLLRLPDEILEEIVSELDQHSDLVAFALSSRICAALVIPHHTQYRILRVRRPSPDMWAHLARRADLARNIREVHICERTNLWAADHYPTTLIDNRLDRTIESSEESVRIRNICQALGHMRRLRVFTWSWKDVQGQQRPTSHPTHENAILTAVYQRPMLEHVSLSGKFAMHALHSHIDPHSSMYPVWKLANLRSLSLAGDTWAKIGNSKHICNLLAKSPNLEYLEVPLEFHHLADCRLPKLKHLKLVLQAGSASMGIDRSRSLFLQNHPSIEVLDWSPVGMPCIPPDILPNLKSLRSNRQFIMALNDPDYGASVLNLMTPPSTPVAATIPVPDEPVPAPPMIQRKIENLDVLSMDAQTLLDLKCIEKESLRRLKLHTFGDISTLHEIAKSFPNIEWLSLPAIHLPTDAPHPVRVSKEQWLDILPRFSKLQVFRGPGLWSSVKNDRQAMHETIMDLVQACPRLRVLDRVDKYDELDSLKQIVITREGDQVEHINYGTSRKPDRNPFDVMDGLFI
ncbi:hypothetical protein GALMADRAFT_1072918 [Galerina marginata CBS 339.88]|uniref:F-box domain-containing protein n=1 Tax=Galerina marginata (strain CBS 339.88) TaxID=685588 RepID=A0A067S9W2_GALM3|nr:hypothetical protein GALMADRAFT_1072918 [Galerina marginata CBS 339.88]